MQLRATISKNIGIFPEQSAHWLWFSKLIAQAKQQPNVLNLFAYTGAATLCAAAAGAKVCHVDAAKSTVTLGATKSGVEWTAKCTDQMDCG